MAISAAQMKQLREQTGAGRLDCKKALTSADGDFDLAVENLRKAGMAKAKKKSDRATNEGRLTTLVGDGAAVFIEILCETDFVSATERFQTFCDELAARALAGEGEGDITEALRVSEEGNIGALVAALQENIKVNRAVRWTSDGALVGYVHPNQPLGVLVDVSGGAGEFSNLLAKHIAAAQPMYRTPDDIPEDVLAKEREIHNDSPDLASKPENIRDKIIEGKLRKWYADVCLSEQEWFFSDDKVKVSKVSDATVSRFVRWKIGA
jgi:elongation factor Ts